MSEDFEMEAVGEYLGNAYPVQAEYRVTMSRSGGDLVLNVEDSGGSPVAKPLVLTDELIEGIDWMASTDHGLGGYEDDWTLPPGMDRQLTWVLQTNLEHHVALREDQIGEIATWLTKEAGQ